ncbi:MAG: outer membrane protein transport protein [Bacteroidales bacterium]|nr:outer membrane protein transport protein [Bacteroidales bacterium]
MKLFRKAVLTAAAVLSVLSANAEGYQINSQSARQWGMAHTGTALKLGAESMTFNPAGMSFMNSKFDVSLGTILIQSKVEFEQGAYKHETDNPLSTPIFGHFGYKINDKLAVGVNITNPAGNSLVWGDNWAGATHIQDVSLKAFNVQPTVSYRISDRISVGAGLMIDFGSFEQRKGLVAPGAFDGLGALAGGLSAAMPSLAPLPGMIQSFSGQVPVGIELEGSSKVAYGFNIGALIDITDKLTLGVSYRSKVKLSVDGGEAELEYANDNAKNVINAIKSFDTTPLQGLEAAGMIPAGTVATLKGTQTQLATMGVLDNSKFNASMPIPSIFSIGAAYKFNENLTFTGEIQVTGWEAYDKMDIAFQTVAGEVLQSSVKNYENTVAVRLGLEYNIPDVVAFRAGLYSDTPPVQMDNYNPETPSADCVGITAGATLYPTKFMAVDLSIGYLQGDKTSGKFQNGTFNGDYTKSAIMPGIGVRFNF